MINMEELKNQFIVIAMGYPFTFISYFDIYTFWKNQKADNVRLKKQKYDRHNGTG